MMETETKDERNRNMGKRTVFFNGHITSLDPTCPQAEALVAEGGRIIAIGSKDEILLEFGRNDVEKVNLEGGYAYPGLADSHLHLSWVGQRLRWLDLEKCRSKEELLATVRQRAAGTRPGQWVVGVGWDEHRLGGEVPDLRELDEACPHHPLFLARHCFHVYLVNSVAYRAAGVRPDEPDPENGAYGRDETGRLNGRVYENASRKFYEAQPEPDYAEKKETMREAARLALSCGLTAVHTEDLRVLGNVETMVRIWRELVEEGIFLRTHQLIYHPHLQELDETKQRAGQGDEWFRIGALKIFADGSLGGRTAWLSEPYADDSESTGLPIHSREELFYLAAQAADRHMPIAVHAIGDRAAELAIAAMEAHPVARESGVTLRHRLIHGQILRPDLIERLKRPDVVVDIQPRFVASDFPWVMERIGKERAEYAYAWKTLLAAGVACAGGSDAPIEPIHPLWGVHAAVTRRRPEDPEDHPGYLPREKLDRLQALLLFTQGSARAAGEEHERGTLSVGKQADLSVFDRDILACRPDELLEAKTMFTVVNGVVAYKE
jgi:predicted amidohydrolase YtcJ